MATTKYLLSAILLAMTSHHVMGQTSPCTQQVQAILKACTNGAGINDANFLWFATNGSSANGQKPADEAGFKDKVCAAEVQIGQCVLSQAVPLFNSTACASTPQVAQSVDSIFFTFDAKCAHPCRGTLLGDLSACYSQAGLPTDLFLSNKTKAQVIGSTDAEATKFCAAKTTLLGCLKTKVESCPESPQILAATQFHPPSYEQVVDILCAHPRVYVAGLKCFEETTPAVEACVQKNTQAFIQTAINAQQQNWTQDRFVRETCALNIDQIKCDLEAWAQKKHESCQPAVIGLRREIECKLLPLNCSATQQAKFNEECNPTKYNAGDRNTFNQGGGAGGLGGSVGGAAARFVPISVFAFIMSIAFVFFV